MNFPWVLTDEQLEEYGNKCKEQALTEVINKMREREQDKSNVDSNMFDRGYTKCFLDLCKEIEEMMNQYSSK